MSSTDRDGDVNVYASYNRLLHAGADLWAVQQQLGNNAANIYHEVGWGSPDESFAASILEVVNTYLPSDSAVVTDSASLLHSTPLYLRVRQALPAWQAIRASHQVLDWIEHGIYMPLLSPIPRFFQSQIVHTAAQLSYWRCKLKLHYLSSGTVF